MPRGRTLAGTCRKEPRTPISGLLLAGVTHQLKLIYQQEYQVWYIFFGRIFLVALEIATRKEALKPHITRTILRIAIAGMGLNAFKIHDL
jgi:hypothetical protein